MILFSLSAKADLPAGKQKKNRTGEKINETSITTK
jgi:hypothetical protein